MSFDVLASQQQIDEARNELDRRGWTFRNSTLRELLWRASRGRFPRVGDRIKSWDVLKTAQFAHERLCPDDPILDLGAYGSEIPPLLRAAGFREVQGIDLNPFVHFMPYSREIGYVRGNFHATGLPAARFALITAISVIEHGYAPDKLLAEVSRLLRPGGYFVASFDYWHEKISTNQVKIFGLDWCIFSESDVREFVIHAAQHGLAPCGPMRFTAADKPVRHAGRDYTFGWIALEKSRAG